MRLIDADALKYKNVAEVNGILTHILMPEEIDNAPTVQPVYFPPCEDCNKKMEEIRQAYDKMKAMERPQGQWIPKRLWDNTHIWVCSECGNQNTHGITVEKACWKCGAEMYTREENNNENDN
jgi:rubrerythrin